MPLWGGTEGGRVRQRQIRCETGGTYHEKNAKKEREDVLVEGRVCGSWQLAACGPLLCFDMNYLLLPSRHL